jgi:hypothetical protein
MRLTTAGAASAFSTSREIVLCETAKRRARSACVAMPVLKALIASARWRPVSVGGRPIWTPRALARVRPSPVRARINSRSNSARPPRTIGIKRPCGVVVSAHVSPRERNPAPAFATVSRMFKRSRVDRANRPRRVTSNVSPAPRACNAFASSRRSALAPLAVSENTDAAPAAVNAATWASSVWQSVLTRAYP